MEINVNNLVDDMFDKICKSIDPGLDKKAAVEDHIKTVSDLAFRTLPAAAFSFPFVLGGLYHLMNKEDKDLTSEHLQRMKGLNDPFLFEQENTKKRKKKK